MKKTYLSTFVVILLITILSEFIGAKAIPLGSLGKIVLLPLLYSVTISLIIVSAGRHFIPFIRKHVGEKEIDFAGKAFAIAMIPLALRLGVMVGSQIDQLKTVGPALLAQQLGNFGTLLFGFPIAMALGVKRETIGATVSICREGTLGVMLERYGSGKPEMLGSLGVYMIGTVFGTIIFSILGSIAPLTGLHPYALAMGSGIGSASMLTAATAAIAEQVPSMKDQIYTFGVTSNLLSNVMESYAVAYVTLPLGNWLYNKFHKNEGAN